MKLQQYSLLLLLLLSFSTIVYGQEENITVDQALKQESIENQFDIVIKKSGRYQEYKVIKQVWINKLKTNITDSLKTLEGKLSTTNAQIATQKNEMSNLEANLAKTNENLSLVTKETLSSNLKIVTPLRFKQKKPWLRPKKNLKNTEEDHWNVSKK